MAAFTAFVLANTRHGAMIVNRFDQIEHEPGYACGVGGELLQMGEYHSSECNALINLMHMRRQNTGGPITVLDVGANVGSHTCRWARALEGCGEVHAFEAQERVFYALAGNLALGNHFNAHAYHVAVGEAPGILGVPTLDHCRPSNFGGLHLRPAADDPGQPVNYSEGLAPTRVVTVDDLCLQPDVIKIDVEGMELEVIRGASHAISFYRPVLYVEHDICGLEKIKPLLPDYVFMEPMGGANVLCIHGEDPLLNVIRSS